jgi:hypothetical protein
MLFPRRGGTIVKFQPVRLNHGKSEKAAFQGTEEQETRARLFDGVIAFAVLELPRNEAAASRLPPLRLL